MNDRSFDIFSGMIVGAALGFLAGLLLAPTSGEETRESLKQKTRSSVDQVRGSVTDLRENLTKRSRELLNSGNNEIAISETESPASTEVHPDRV